MITDVKPLSFFLITILFAGDVVAQVQTSSAAPAGFRAVSEIIKQWTPDQHLWVRGEIGVSEGQLSDLESWLDQNGPNWTIVLMQNASGQTWRNFRGMTAVEHALGYGLSNQTGFGKLTDQRTGESNGAVFVLFLAERKFSYFASDAFDERGLGESRWIGNLDRRAVSAMRSGGRIVDAVKVTVSSIEASLSKKIQAEEETRRRAAIEKKRLMEESLQLGDRLLVVIREAESRAAQARSENPQLTGDLFTPEAGDWTANARAVADYAASGDYLQARSLYDSTHRKIASFHQGIDDWSSQSGDFDALAQRIKEHPHPAELSVLQGDLSTANEALSAARLNYQKGDSLYARQLEEGLIAVNQADQAYHNWVREQERKQHQALVRLWLIRTAVGLAIILLMVGLLIANRMRRPEKENAEEELKRWRDLLRGKFDQLFNLMDRAALIAGPESKPGFTGETKKISRAAIRGVDELFIMSTATDRVMDLAEGLIEPRSLWGLLVNAFSAKRFNKAVALLGAEPIGFDREQGLEAILSPSAKQSGREVQRSILGRTEDYKPFRMSFEKLTAAYDEKQSGARENIERLEHCIDGLPLLEERVGGCFDLLDRKTDFLLKASREDGWFPVAAIRNKLIPAARENLNEAAEVGRSDPITAMEKAAAIAERQVNEALRMVNKIESVRKIDFPVIAESVDFLEKKKRRTGWVDLKMNSLIGRSEQIAALAVARSVSEDWEELEDDLTRLKGEVVSSAKLVERVGTEILPSIEARADRFAKARKTVSKRLKLDPEKVLIEENLSPGNRIEGARHQLEAAVAALDHGNIGAAQATYLEIESQLTEADEEIRLSQEALEQYPKRREELLGHRQKVLESVPEARILLTELREKYAAAVVLFSARYGEKVSGQQSVSDCIDQAETRLSRSADSLEESSLAYREGRLIACLSLLERSANELGFAEHQVALIEDQHAALKKAEEKDAENLTALLARCGDMKTSVEDRRTCQSTVDEYLHVGKMLARDEFRMKKEKPDPFAVFHSLAGVTLNLNAVESGIEADWKLFQLTMTALEKVGNQAQSCGKVIQKAESDGIVDSEAITRSIQSYEQLLEDRNKMEKQLGVDHGDWSTAFQKVNEIASNVVRIQSVLVRELKAAKEAADQINQTSNQISKLQKWRSRHSVKLDRNAGLGAWEDAGDLLSSGDYLAARKLAIEARAEMKLALTQAKNLERQRSNAAAAAKRRAMRAALRKSSHSGWSSSSWSSGFSSSSFSSGSSSSGFSRSGW